MGSGRRVAWVVAGLLVSGVAQAEEWETVLTAPYVVKTRDVEGSGVKEYRVEGKMGASVEDLQATLCDAGRFSRFMPHVKESRVLKSNGAVDLVYVRVDPPVGSGRDYISEVRTEDDAQKNGGTRFRQSWRAVPDYLPERRGLVRLQVNEGSWDISSAQGGAGESQFVYRFRVDPGGWVPGFVQNMANKEAIPDTLRAIEKEAQRRAQERTEAAALAPKPPTPAN